MKNYYKVMQWQFGNTTIEYSCSAVDLADLPRKSPVIMGIKYGHSDIIKKLKEQILISCSQRASDLPTGTGKSRQNEAINNLDLIIDENDKGMIFNTKKIPLGGVYDISNNSITITYEQETNDGRHSEYILIDRRTGTLTRKIRSRVKILDRYEDIGTDIYGECKKVDVKQF